MKARTYRENEMNATQVSDWKKSNHYRIHTKIQGTRFISEKNNCISTEESIPPKSQINGQYWTVITFKMLRFLSNSQSSTKRKRSSLLNCQLVMSSFSCKLNNRNLPWYKRSKDKIARSHFLDVLSKQPKVRKRAFWILFSSFYARKVD